MIKHTMQTPDGLTLVLTSADHGITAVRGNEIATLSDGHAFELASYLRSFGVKAERWNNGVYLG